jgi:hypothetical protein
MLEEKWRGELEMGGWRSYEAKLIGVLKGSSRLRRLTIEAD